MLYTVAYPELSAEASTFVEGLRALHDPQHGVVAAHFTLLFASSSIDVASYTTHVRAVATDTAEIVFACRRAVTVLDVVLPRVQVHLVPDEGSAAITSLHDRLYGGIMAPLQRLDLSYVPHMTIASMPDPQAAAAWCDRLNRAGLDVSGRLCRLTIGTLRDGRFHELSQQRLAQRP